MDTFRTIYSYDIHFVGKGICIAYRTVKDCGCGCKRKKSLEKNAETLKRLTKYKLSRDNLDLMEDIQSQMGPRWWDEDAKSKKVTECER